MFIAIISVIKILLWYYYSYVYNFQFIYPSETIL